MMADKIEYEGRLITEGYVHRNAGDDYDTAGINIGVHGHAIECYARPASEAIKLRAYVMAALAAYKPPVQS